MSVSIKVLNEALPRVLQKTLENGVKIWRWVSGAVSERDVAFKESPLEPEKLVEIINARFNPDRKSQLSAVFGDSDFLPFSFLERGIKRGTGVCRLVRWYGGTLRYRSDIDFEAASFEEAGLIQLIQAVSESSAARVAIGLSSLTDTDLASILSISPDQVAAFFEGNQDDPLAALQPKKLKSLMPIPVATGFLVGRNFLLTNHHVLRHPADAKEFAAEFGYEQDMFGRITLPVQYELEPDCFFTSSQLDYTLIKLKRNRVFGDAGEVFGYLPMLEDPNVIAPSLTPAQAEELKTTSSTSLKSGILDRVNRPNLLGETTGLPGEPVNIIQHPKGQPKQIVLSSNRVQQITKDFLRYEADADFSSSGSPVLNQQWQLVALHHASLADNKFNILGQEGIRISSIVASLDFKAKQIAEGNARLTRAIELLDATKKLPLLQNVENIRESLNQKAMVVQEAKNKFVFDQEILSIIQRRPEGEPLDLLQVKGDLLSKVKEQVIMAKAALEQAEESVDLPDDIWIDTLSDEDIVIERGKLYNMTGLLSKNLSALNNFFEFVIREEAEIQNPYTSA